MSGWYQRWSPYKGYVFNDEYDDKAIIGGRSYDVVKIGNQIWLAENLDYKFDGLTVGTPGVPDEPSAWYYNNDETTYGKVGKNYGLLYNEQAMDMLVSQQAALIPGWHVPSIEEWNELASTIGGIGTAGGKLKSAVMWNKNAGTDDYGFSALPAGMYFGIKFFGELGYTGFWSSDKGGEPREPEEGKYPCVGYSIRLVRND